MSHISLLLRTLHICAVLGFFSLVLYLSFDHCLLNNYKSKKPINSKAYIVGQWKPHFSLQHHINAYGVSIYAARPHLINRLPHIACLSLCLFPSSLIFLPLLPCTIDSTVSFSHYSLHTHPLIHMNFPMGPTCDLMCANSCH